MLSKKELLEKADIKYHNMLKEISVVDFTKCVAQLSGLKIQDVSDEIILKYLLTWAKNKYRFYEMLKKTKVDIPITYKIDKKNIDSELNDLVKKFPGYAPWLLEFRDIEKNKISSLKDIRYNGREWICNFFPNVEIIGMNMTHFFKKYLEAPEELVTELGKIFETDIFKGFHTISIDPVDIMLASENPYKWTSCYRLEVSNEASHADGCLAALLDDSSLITYTWNKEGEFCLYKSFDFKKIRYKRTREWISISPSFSSIFFCDVYPQKYSCPEELKKLFRENIEKVVAEHLNVENKWVKNSSCYVDCERINNYGYDEYSDPSRIYQLANDTKYEFWSTYNEEILCPCGCGEVLPGSGEDTIEYDGNGFIHSNFNEMYWCEYADEYCYHECNEDECSECHEWKNCHPVCELDPSIECPTVDWAATDEGVCSSNGENCKNCSLCSKTNFTYVNTTLDQKYVCSFPVIRGDIISGSWID